MKHDDYTVISLARPMKASGWRRLRVCTVVNRRTLTIREMTIGRIQFLKYRGHLRIDERIFMNDRYKHGVKE